MKSGVSVAISIFGLGYVGCVSAACFAHMGHQVVGVDVNPAKVEMLQSGKSPIIELRMDELVAEARDSGRLQATRDPSAAIHKSDISFICVGTPSLRSGKIDLRHVENVCHEIGKALQQKQSHHVVGPCRSWPRRHRITAPRDAARASSGYRDETDPISRSGARDRYRRASKPACVGCRKTISRSAVGGLEKSDCRRQDAHASALTHSTRDEITRFEAEYSCRF